MSDTQSASLIPIQKMRKVLHSINKEAEDSNMFDFNLFEYNTEYYRKPTEAVQRTMYTADRIEAEKAEKAKQRQKCKSCCLLLVIQCKSCCLLLVIHMIVFFSFMWLVPQIQHVDDGRHSVQHVQFVPLLKRVHLPDHKRLPVPLEYNTMQSIWKRPVARRPGAALAVFVPPPTHSAPVTDVDVIPAQEYWQFIVGAAATSVSVVRIEETTSVAVVRVEEMTHDDADAKNETKEVDEMVLETWMDNGWNAVYLGVFVVTHVAVNVLCAAAVVVVPE